VLIECPFCHAQARIPESKEGARVRCGECEQLYVARDPSRRRSKGTQPATIAIWVSAGLAAVLVVLLLRRNQSTPLPVPTVTAPASEAAPRERPVDRTGWGSAPVIAARGLFEAADTRDEDRLERLLATGEGNERAGLVTALSAAALEDPAAPGDEGEDEGEGQAEGDGAAAAAVLERARLARDWKPFDGSVLEESDQRASVRLQVSGRAAETAAETRQVDVKLVRTDGAWQVAGWARYQTPEELEATARAERARLQPKRDTLEVKHLEDGSLVTEAEPAPIPFPDDMPQEQRERIERELGRMLDLKLPPRDSTAARRALVDAGASALPALLTALYELPLETLEDSIRVNLVNQCLEEITGLDMGFEPQVQEGSTTGTSAERRDSSLRQWFAWWYTEGLRFEGRAEGGDALEGLIVPTERDRREMERGNSSPGGGSG
jgi:predicted Zn finger-like uncharacterized protein